ncbi:uncharacterized protein ACHE_50453S [Aspergillus chevalieri]|uniref:Uncharacterized protein n=1 Tax=Aspergillus chevalieri TaxID=182096 RepID=A0A7R7ZNV1_ASPCH|nr:uncharacterized protein ACHE_50453S [Aspergillus chevalieri]BCR89255.1 hypothetical protein ACHE_50453S [Aspergillus chevalieri]
MSGWMMDFSRVPKDTKSLKNGLTNASEITAARAEHLVDALIEWPSSRTPDLVALLTAISKTTDNLHWNEAVDDDEEFLACDGVPYINMVWRDANWMMMHVIIKKCSKSDDFETSKRNARDNYLKTQDVEAQPRGSGARSI